MQLPDGRETLTALLPITLGGHRPAVRLSPPRLGEHNRQLLAELGYATAQIEALSPPA
jgi:crotonobetainyl-CoA:carnitine CoA-transferase CaiB-like acyl-CoA transferase